MAEADGASARRGELLEALERAFGERITAGTAGEMADEIAARLGTGEVHFPLRATAVELLRTVLAELTGREKGEIGEETELGTLIPPLRRRPVWRRLAETFDTELPDLERPTAVFLLVLLGGVGLFLLALALGQGLGRSIGGAVTSWGFLGLVTKAVKLTFPDEARTVGRLADHLVLRAPKLLRGESAVWSRGQILEVVLAGVREVYEKEEADEATPL